MGIFDEYVTYPSKINEDPVQSVDEKPLTNGDVISMAIRDQNSTLRFEMERRFQTWCNETHHSVYSAGDKKIWKGELFEK